MLAVAWMKTTAVGTHHDRNTASAQLRSMYIQCMLSLRRKGQASEDASTTGAVSMHSCPQTNGWRAVGVPQIHFADANRVLQQDKCLQSSAGTHLTQCTNWHVAGFQSQVCVLPDLCSGQH